MKRKKSTNFPALYCIEFKQINAANATSEPFCKKPPLASNCRRRHPIAYSSIIALQLLHCLCAAAASPPPLLPPSPLPPIAKPKYTPPYPQPSP